MQLLPDAVRALHLADALQHAEERFVATFELAPVGIAHVAPDGRWLRVNGRLCTILGYGGEELLDLRFQDLTHPEDLAADLDQALRTVAGEQSSYRIEKRYVRKDGTSVWADVRVSLVREAASEKPLYFVAVVNDISLQRRAEEALARRSAELQALLDHLPDIVARFDRQGRHLYVNPAVERATGLSAGQFIGLTNRDLGMPAELVDQWDTALAAVLETGESGEMEFAFPSPDGERRFWSLMVPEHDADGSIVGALSVARDITDTAALTGAACEPEVSTVQPADAFHALFEQAGMGMAELALDGRWIRVNERLCEMVGNGARELEGRLFQEITITEDHARVLGQIHRLAGGDASACSLRQRFIRRDGETVYADVTMALVADAQGRPRHLLAVLHDLSARRRAEAHLADSEARLRFLAEMIPHLVWSARADGHHDYYNHRWMEYTGLPASVHGPRWSRILHPDDLGRAKAVWRRSLEAGEPYSMELRIREKGGGYRWFLALALPLRGEGGQVVRWFGTCTDIQAQKDSEQALRETQERLRAALSASGTATFRWNLRTGDVAWDAELDRLFGIAEGTNPHSAAGFLLAVHPDDRARLARAVDRCAAGEECLEEEFRVVWPDGTVHWLLDKCVTTPGDDGRPLFLTGACHDVTAHRAAEAEREALLQSAENARAHAERADQLKSRFVAHISHEVRTPINVVLGYAGLLDAGVHGPLNDQQQEHVRRILRSGRHLVALVNDVLDLAKVEAGEMTVLRRAVEIGTLCRNVVEMIEPLAASRGITVTVEGAGSGIAAWGDEDRIRQILLNLMNNACKFTPVQGRVILRCGLAVEAPAPLGSGGSGPWVRIDVNDTGIGVEAEMRERIFAPFVQGARARQEAGGTGLGLAISRTLARAMDGDIVLTSPPGEGSCFTLWLRAADPAPTG
ncbi:MAG TPA: PAS domain S-box protein [Longimicrobium sp.]